MADLTGAPFEVQEAVQGLHDLLGNLENEKMKMALSLVEPELLEKLRAAMPSQADEGSWDNYRGSKGKDGDREKGKRGGKGGDRQKGDRPKGDRKGGGKGDKGKRNEGPVELTFLPQDMPETAEPTGEQVAFQAQIGTAWRVMGPHGGTFKWNLQDREAVPAETKAEVKQILSNYAEDNGIELGSNGVKLALRRGDFWISWAGGISSCGTEWIQR